MNKTTPTPQAINPTTEINCEGCHIFCEKKRAFTIRKHTKSETIAFANNKKHLNFVRSGSVRIRTKNNEECICSERQMFLLVESEDYSIDVLEDCEILSLSFINAFQVCDKMTIDDMYRIIGDYQYRFHTLNFNEAMTQFTDSVAWYIDNGVYCNYIHNAKQLELFVVCRLCYPLKEILEFFYPSINNKINFQSIVRANHANANNVEELAMLCGYSLDNFKKVFSTNFKQSPYQWMLQQNAPLIKIKLLDKTIPIKVIAAEFGFTSQSHLNRYCKQHLGGTSAQIRYGKGGKQPINQRII